MGILERYRTWKMRRRIKGIYIKKLAKYSGIPHDKITGMDLGKMEFEP